MRIAAAQTLSEPGALAANCTTHWEACRMAADLGVSVVVFPELSLSGYELPLLRDCVLEPASPILDPLRALAVQREMLIVAGAPVAAEDGRGVSIASISFLPDGRTEVYRKHFLHPGEAPYAVPGSEISHIHRVFPFDAALAICADTTHGEHPAAAHARGASLYLASVLWSPGGYDVDAAMIEDYSRKYHLAALVSNHGGPSGGYPSAGRSAFWEPGGRRLGAAPDLGSALLLAEHLDGRWRCETVTLGA
ncbi:MAG: carbon-nitrogen hydrolase family protein [Holophaga sp.]